MEIHQAQPLPLQDPAPAQEFRLRRAERMPVRIRFGEGGIREVEVIPAHGAAHYELDQNRRARIEAAILRANVLPRGPHGEA